MAPIVFENRRHAGRELAARLASRAPERPIVLALPRGGVPVAFEVAQAIQAPLDVLMVRKLGAPRNPELAIGAVAEDGTAVLNLALVRGLGMTRKQFDDIITRETRELHRQMERFHDDRQMIDVHGRATIVVDDGLATGLSDLAVVRALRRREAAQITVAVPVGSVEATAMLAEEADEIVCHIVPQDFVSVGNWYEDFAPVSDEEVLTLLAQAAGRTFKSR